MKMILWKSNSKKTSTVSQGAAERVSLSLNLKTLTWIHPVLIIKMKMNSLIIITVIWMVLEMVILLKIIIKPCKRRSANSSQKWKSCRNCKMRLNLKISLWRSSNSRLHSRWLRMRKHLKPMRILSTLRVYLYNSYLKYLLCKLNYLFNDCYRTGNGEELLPVILSMMMLSKEETAALARARDQLTKERQVKDQVKKGVLGGLFTKKPQQPPQWIPNDNKGNGNSNGNSSSVTRTNNQ